MNTALDVLYVDQKPKDFVRKDQFGSSSSEEEQHVLLGTPKPPSVHPRLPMRGIIVEVLPRDMD
jgi:hypothetical protein